MAIATEQLRFINLEKQAWTWRGYKIQYLVMGEGKPLVLVHAFIGSIGHWRKNISVLADAGYKVYAVDLLGFGGSDKPQLNYSMELWIEQLKDFWTAHIQEPAVFIGNSIGALMSLVVVTEYPEISAGAILINSPGGFSDGSEDFSPLTRMMMATVGMAIQTPLVGQVFFNSARQKELLRRVLYLVYRDRSAVTEELVDIVYTPMCDPGSRQVFACILTLPPVPSLGELIPNLKCPLLIIRGADDPWTSVIGAKIYKDAYANSKDIKIVPIPGAGHCPHDEVPDIVNATIIDWLTLYNAG
jgi:non-heme chloroperoxidase